MCMAIGVVFQDRFYCIIYWPCPSPAPKEAAWIQAALADVEVLKEENKYSCDRCLRLVEAERSMHYSSVPIVLTLHLKRFAMLSGYVWR